jgi:hypothetical protein
MGFQSFGSPNFENFGTPNLGVLGKNDIWVQPLWPSTKNTIKEEGGGFPQVEAMVNFMSLCMFMVHPCIKSDSTMH